jgi:hypothetical protein
LYSAFPRSHRPPRVFFTAAFGKHSAIVFSFTVGYVALSYLFCFCLSDHLCPAYFSVTTRTTTLTDVPHTSFALRFSDLAEIETACKEEEEKRAVRTIDWIGERINKRSAKWVEDMEKANEKDVLRTPWWDELRRCAEGDHIPSRVESWNHPAASACLSFCLFSVTLRTDTKTQLYWQSLLPHPIPCKQSQPFIQKLLSYQHGWIRSTFGIRL